MVVAAVSFLHARDLRSVLERFDREFLQRASQARASGESLAALEFRRAKQLEAVGARPLREAGGSPQGGRGVDPCICLPTPLGGIFHFQKKPISHFFPGQPVISDPLGEGT